MRADTLDTVGYCALSDPPVNRSGLFRLFRSCISFPSCMHVLRFLPKLCVCSGSGVVNARLATLTTGIEMKMMAFRTGTGQDGCE